MKTKSLLRKSEYEELERLEINGKILDVGGSRKADYLKIIKGNYVVTVGNINNSVDADVFFDAEKKFPFDDSSFDAVLFMNLLEHLFNYKNAVEEARRVLKPRGLVAGVVPFMFYIHSCPNDYFRFTKSALVKIFEDAGFDVRVKELGTGAFSVIYQIFIGFSKTSFLASLFIKIARALDHAWFKIRPKNKMTEEYMPLGYYFEAIKK